jgi:putative acetyltransferase
MSKAENTIIRPFKPADRPGVLDLTTRAFKQPDEAKIIQQLERDGDVWLEVVGELDGKIVGHILFYVLPVRNKLGAMGLGPMSVDPKVQNKGIGTALVNFGLKEAKDANVPLVFVLGHEKYYPRFGFSVEATKEFETIYKGPHFMAVRFRYGPPMSGQLMFPAAFDAAPQGKRH